MRTVAVGRIGLILGPPHTLLGVGVPEGILSRVLTVPELRLALARQDRCRGHL